MREVAIREALCIRSQAQFPARIHPPDTLGTISGTTASFPIVVVPEIVPEVSFEIVIVSEIVPGLSMAELFVSEIVPDARWTDAVVP